MTVHKRFEKLKANLEQIHGDESLKGAIILDGFDDAIIGSDATGPRLIYSVAKILDILRSQGMGDDADGDDAVSYFEYNVLGGHYGENTPIFMQEFEVE